MPTKMIDLTISKKELKDNLDEILAQISVGMKVIVTNDENEPIVLFLEPKFYDEYTEATKQNKFLARKVKDLEYIKREKIPTLDNLVESQKSLLKIKSKFPLFANCTDIELLSVVQNVKIMKLQPKEKIFIEGDSSEEIYFVISGQVDIIKNAHDAEKIKLLGKLPANTIFGEMAYITKSPRSATARTSKSSPCVLICFNIKENVTESLEYIYTKIYFNFTRELAKKLENQNCR